VTVVVVCCAEGGEVVSVDADVDDAESDARMSGGTAEAFSAGADEEVTVSATASEAVRISGCCAVRHRAAPTPATTSTPALSTKAAAISAPDPPVRCWECLPIR
jgi:hypothetical protein